MPRALGLFLHGKTGRFNEQRAWTGEILNMTSQTWLTAEDSSQPQWWHLLIVITVDDEDIRRQTPEGKNETAILYIDGYHNGEIPTAHDEEVLAVAELSVATGLTGCLLLQIPNEPIIFPADPIQKSRSEDAIIAFTWDQYLQHMDRPEWIVQLPMVKSAIRAMDTVTSHLELATGTIDFVLAGASKRGWTTWLAAAADAKYGQRVKAIVPLVFDDLNFRHNLHHHYRAYGGWSFAFEDYYEMNITARLDDDDATSLFNIIDPMFCEYSPIHVSRRRSERTHVMPARADKDRLTMPKLVVDATGDEFFVLDDWAFWTDKGFPSLPGNNHFLMAPDTEHSLATGILEIVPSISAFINVVVQSGAAHLPTVSWAVDSTSGDIELELGPAPAAPDVPVVPSEVTVWHATTCNTERRDFRLVNIDDPCTCGVAQDGSCLNLQVLWTHETLNVTKDGKYSAHMDPPEDGTWGAFLIDVKFAGTNTGYGWPVGRWGQLEFTSQVSVVPNTFPFEDCSGTGCYGTLV